MKAWFAAEGIAHEMNCSFSSVSNMAERYIRTVVEGARAKLLHANLPAKFWVEAVRNYVWEINRSPKQSLDGKSPIEVASGRQANWRMARVFGSRCRVTVPKDLRVRGHKFSERAQEAVCLGISQDSKGWLVFVEGRRAPLPRRSVHFDLSDDKYDHHAATKRVPAVGTPVPGTPSVRVDRAVAAAETPEEKNFRERPRRTPKPVSTFAPLLAHNAERQKFFAGMAQALEADEKDNGVTYSLREFSRRAYAFLAKSASGVKVPHDYEEAMRSLHRVGWGEAMADEVASLRKQGVFRLVKAKKGVKVLGTRWVFDVKLTETGSISRLKARLVVKGFSQVRGIHYHRTFAPVCRLESVRLILSIAASKKLYLHQIDFKTAYLNSNLDIELYAKPPPGINIPMGFVWKLEKACYGLKQAGRRWYETINKVLLDIGFVRLDADHCVYVLRRSGAILYLVLYVDDCGIAYSDKDILTFVLEEIKKFFVFKDMGKLRWFLGFLVTQAEDRSWIRISQEGYIRTMLQTFGLWEITTAPTPCATTVDLFPKGKPCEKDNKAVASKPYRQLVGSLLYAAHVCRPDIATVVGFLARFLDCPHKVHWDTAVRICKYLKGSLNLGILYHGAIKLFGFSDANWGKDVEGHSTSGYVFFLNEGGASVWGVKKQRSVAISSCEAEIYAASLAAAVATWIRKFMVGCGFKPNGATLIWEDNEGAISLSHDPTQHSRAKHIYIKDMFIREKVERKEVFLKHVRTNENVADFFTKNLSRDVFRQFRNVIMGECA